MGLKNNFRTEFPVDGRMTEGHDAVCCNDVGRRQI
jgi:hypothetical protein